MKRKGKKKVRKWKGLKQIMRDLSAVSLLANDDRFKILLTIRNQEVMNGYNDHLSVLDISKVVEIPVEDVDYHLNLLDVVDMIDFYDGWSPKTTDYGDKILRKFGLTKKKIKQIIKETDFDEKVHDMQKEDRNYIG